MKKYNILYWCGLWIDDIIIESDSIYHALEKFKTLHDCLDDLISIKIFND